METSNKYPDFKTFMNKALGEAFVSLDIPHNEAPSKRYKTEKDLRTGDARATYIWWQNESERLREHLRPGMDKLMKRLMRDVHEELHPLIGLA